MSQNPYAQAGGFGGGYGGGPAGGAPVDEYDPVLGSQRTSVLAIMALVFGLVCFLPGTGVLAVLLGTGALFAINRARGRLTGTGLAVSGIVLGLIFTTAWVLMVLSLSYMLRSGVLEPVSGVMEGIETGDRARARAMFSPAADAAITDEQLDAFRDAYRAQVGGFQSVPDSLSEYIGAFFDVGQLMQNYRHQGSQIIPTPATFDNRRAIVLIESDDSAQSATGPGKAGPGDIRIRNIGVLIAPGQEIWLVPPAGTAAPLSAPGAPTGPDGGTGQEAEGGETGG